MGITANRGLPGPEANLQLVPLWTIHGPSHESTVHWERSNEPTGGTHISRQSLRIVGEIPDAFELGS